MVLWWSSHSGAASRTKKGTHSEDTQPLGSQLVLGVQYHLGDSSQSKASPSLILHIHKHNDQERARANHTHGDIKVKIPAYYFIVKNININYNVDWMLVSALQCVSAKHNHVRRPNYNQEGAQWEQNGNTFCGCPCGLTLCTVRVRQAQRRALTRARLLSESDAEPRQSDCKSPQTAPPQGSIDTVTC